MREWTCFTLFQRTELGPGSTGRSPLAWKLLSNECWPAIGAGSCWFPSAAKDARLEHCVGWLLQSLLTLRSYKYIICEVSNPKKASLSILTGCRTFWHENPGCNFQWDLCGSATVKTVFLFSKGFSLGLSEITQWFESKAHDIHSRQDVSMCTLTLKGFLSVFMPFSLTVDYDQTLAGYPED